MNRLGRRITTRYFERFIDDDRSWRVGKTQHFSDCSTNKIAVDDRHALDPPVCGVSLDEFVDLSLTTGGDTIDIFSKTTRIRVNIFNRGPEELANLLRSLFPQIPLKEHLHGEFTGLTPSSHYFFTCCATAGSSFVDASLRWMETISMAAIAASKPLFPAFNPARSRACSSVSQVSTPKA